MNSKMLSPLSSKCSVCQTETGLDDSFCQECGVSLVAPEPTIKETPKHEETFKKIRGVIRLPLWIVVSLLLVVSTFTVFAWVGSYDAFSEDYICEHAKKLIAQNNTQEAAEILQRLYLARGQSLKKETVALLGQSLIARSDVFLAKGQKEQAVRDLNAVPNGSATFDLAREKLQALVSPVVPTVPAFPLVVAHTRVKAALSSKNVVKLPKVAPAVSPTITSSADAPLRSPENAKESQFASQDVARYNELLAGYFTKSIASETSELDKDSKSANLVVKEPPTFKEWVSRGRPEF